MYTCPNCGLETEEFDFYFGRPDCECLYSETTEQTENSSAEEDV